MVMVKLAPPSGATPATAPPPSRSASLPTNAGPTPSRPSERPRNGCRALPVRTPPKCRRGWTGPPSRTSTTIVSSVTLAASTTGRPLGSYAVRWPSGYRLSGAVEPRRSPPSREVAAAPPRIRPPPLTHIPHTAAASARISATSSSTGWIRTSRAPILARSSRSLTRRSSRPASPTINCAVAGVLLRDHAVGQGLRVATDGSHRGAQFRDTESRNSRWRASLIASAELRSFSASPTSATSPVPRRG